MRRLLYALNIMLAFVWVTAAAQTPSSFDDLPKEHWAYQAASDLQTKRILKGYPDGFFRGKRTLTRYEFAVALDRLLRDAGLSPKPGAAAATGPANLAGLRAED